MPERDTISTLIEAQNAGATTPRSASSSQTDHSPWRGLAEQRPFFENAEIGAILSRAVLYARSGIPVHFQGSAGLGKTSLALVTAARLGRPVSYMAGHDFLDSGDLIGREIGHSSRAVVDKFVQRVRRTDTQLRYDWAQSVLAHAMEQGHTLVYDEFTRSSARANGILLSVLEEGVLLSTDLVNPKQSLQAHPAFRIILTSNPHDYAGVNLTPDALLDRMITFNLGSFSQDTRIGIVAARTGLCPKISARIIRLMDHLGGEANSDRSASLRSAIMVARIAALRSTAAQLPDALLAQITADVLNGRGQSVTPAQVAMHLSGITTQLDEDMK